MLLTRYVGGIQSRAIVVKVSGLISFQLLIAPLEAPGSGGEPWGLAENDSYPSA